MFFPAFAFAYKIELYNYTVLSLRKIFIFWQGPDSGLYYIANIKLIFF